METWVTCIQCPDYEVSSHGRIRRAVRAKRTYVGLIKAQRNVRGYRTVTVYIERRRRPLFVHRLVTAAFLGPIPDGFQVNHKNGVKHDNRIENLEYVTPRENTQHAANVIKTRKVGEEHHRAKLTEDEVRQILRLHLNGSSTVDLGAQFGVSSSMIGFIVRRKNWRHVQIDD